MIAWILLPAAAVLAFVLAAAQPDLPPLRQEPFTLGSGIGVAKAISVDRPLVLPRIFGDFDATLELELPEDVEFDLVLRLMVPHEVGSEVLSFPARFSVLRLSTIAKGPAWWSRETLLFDELALHEVTGGVQLTPGLPATVWIEGRGRRVRANVAGQWTDWTEVVDDRGTLGMVLRDRRPPPAEPETDPTSSDPQGTPVGDDDPDAGGNGRFSGLAAHSAEVAPTREVRLKTMTITPHPVVPQPRDLVWTKLLAVALGLGAVLAWLFTRSRRSSFKPSNPEGPCAVETHLRVRFWLGVAVATCALPVCAHYATVMVESRALPLTQRSWGAYWWLACSGVPFAIAALAWGRGWSTRLVAVLCAGAATLGCVEAALRLERPRAMDDQEAAVVEWFGPAADTLPFDVTVPRLRNPLEVHLPDPESDVVLFVGGGRQLWAPASDFSNPGPALLAVAQAAQQLGKPGENLRAAFVPTAYGPVARDVALWQRYLRGFAPPVVVAGLGLLESEPQPARSQAVELAKPHRGEPRTDSRQGLAWFDGVPQWSRDPGTVAALGERLRELHQLAAAEGAELVLVSGPFLPPVLRAAAQATAEELAVEWVVWREDDGNAAHVTALQAALVKTLAGEGK